MSGLPDRAGFEALRSEIGRYPRQHGYYRIELIDIAALRAGEPDEEALLDTVFRKLDDQPWSRSEQVPPGLRWGDHRTEPGAAREHAVAALVGGPAIGHLRPTISRERAEELVARFEAQFDAPRAYYTGMGFGDPEYVYLHGVAIVSPARAGILWVVESD